MIRLGVTAAVAVVVLLATQVAPSLFQDDDGPPAGGAVANPIDAKQQTELAFGERSHWLQPWRGYLDTVPATRLRRAIGINFNVEPVEAEQTARLLERSGVRRARVEFSWRVMSFERPGRIADRSRLRTILRALRRHHIRPLVLLNANHGAPGPTRFFNAELAEPAPAGARTVRLAAGTAKRVTPALSGLNRSDGKAADVLFTALRPDGTAELSKPLPRALSAGSHPAATLAYPPFGPPFLEDGRPNPVFEQTLAGWITYARAVVRFTRSVLRSQAFDVEIWNELSFGSDFLNANNYFDPPRERGKGDVVDQVLRRTLAALRGPGSPAPAIGIGNGFASQSPFPAGSTSPPGLIAIDKHPYYGIKRFPKDAIQNGVSPVDANGFPDFREEKLPSGDLVRRDRFIPSYEAFFPEYILSGIQTENMVRDLSPFTTDVYGTAHGRHTRPEGGRPPALWITEANLDPTGADPADPSNVGGGPIDRLRAADVRHLHAKAALRYYTAFASKGVSAVHLFAVKDGNLALVDPGFFARLKRSPRRYPGDRAGGATMAAVRRLVGALGGARRISRPQRLSLLRISDRHDHKQFEGDGSPGHPPLYDRDVVAFFPFQLQPGRWVAATYVMTRNLAKLYDDDSSDPARYDLPPANFRLTVGGVRARRVKASATDPLTGASVPARIVSRRGGRVVLEVPLTDSPRLVSLDQR